jgi:hypothetical protein
VRIAALDGALANFHSRVASAVVVSGCAWFTLKKRTSGVREKSR